jgi:hypothetical protein
MPGCVWRSSHSGRLLDFLTAHHVDTLIVRGGETDVCALSTPPIHRYVLLVTVALRRLGYLNDRHTIRAIHRLLLVAFTRPMLPSLGERGTHFRERTLDAGNRHRRVKSLGMKSNRSVIA